MKIYELIIIKGGFIYDDDGFEEQLTKDVEVKFYKTEQERDAAYHNLVDPYIKLREFQKELRHDPVYIDNYGPKFNEINKKCAEFASEIGCDIKNCCNTWIRADNLSIYIKIYILNPCDNCDKNKVCNYDNMIACEAHKEYNGPDINESPNKFYHVFKKETEI